MGGSIGWCTIGDEITRKSSTEDLGGRPAARSRAPLLGGFDPAAAPRPPDLALAHQTSLAASHGTALGHRKRAVAEPVRLRTAAGDHEASLVIEHCTIEVQLMVTTAWFPPFGALPLVGG